MHLIMHMSRSCQSTALNNEVNEDRHMSDDVVQLTKLLELRYIPLLLMQMILKCGLFSLCHSFAYSNETDGLTQEGKICFYIVDIALY